jgi:hypothetical protein
MTFKPAVWFPIAVGLSAINLAAVWFAAAPGQSLHATTHAVLAVAFGLWAQRLRQRPSQRDLQALVEDLDSREVEAIRLRQELAEAQERLDFTERMLTQAAEPRRDAGGGPPAR